MNWILYAVSILLIAAGSWLILYTAEARNTLNPLLRNTQHKALSILPFTIGLLLVVSAGASLHAWLVRLLGLLAIVKGLFILTNPGKLWNRLADWYIASVSDQAYRLSGIVSVILGTAVLSWIN